MRGGRPRLAESKSVRLSYRLLLHAQGINKQRGKDFAEAGQCPALDLADAVLGHAESVVNTAAVKRLLACA